MKKTPTLFMFSMLLLLTFSSSNSDFDALLSFKATSDRSNSLSSWLNSTHHCSWLGIACNTDATQVTQLVLQNFNLTGPIDSLTQLTHLRLLSLKHNNLTSTTTLDFSQLKNLKLLYLSHNQFSGNFPAGISELQRLHRVDLSYNRFSGEIPLTPLSELPHLLTIRLESNSFSGLLQNSSEVYVFKSLVDFNVSENQLYGEIPKPLSLFPSTSFVRNKNLCGEPLENKCMDDHPLPVVLNTEHGRRKKFSGISILLILLIDFFIVALIGTGIFIGCRRVKLRKDSKKDVELKRGVERDGDEGMVFFEGCKCFKVEELLKASAEMLGKGSVGTTYKVVMENGDVVVVKRTKEKRKKKEIEGLLKDIGGLRHRNVASLRAYYCSKDELLLVYDFLPNGSLHSLLHGNRGPGRTPLDWATRLKIALDVAEGLVFLHDTSKSKLSHGHLSSCNVVIDQEGNACISDVALHQLLLITAPVNNEYSAPELSVSSHNSRKFSQSIDVFSFGVILLEILTGRVAGGGGGTSLVKWVQSMGRDKWIMEVYDFELLRYNGIEGQLAALLQVALLCLSPSPRDRPKINAVHKMIKDIIARGPSASSGNVDEVQSDSSTSS